MPRYVVHLSQKHKRPGFKRVYPERTFPASSFGTGLHTATEYARTCVKGSGPEAMLEAVVFEVAGGKETIKFRCWIDEHGKYDEDAPFMRR